MTEERLLERIRTSTLRRLTGAPEHWLTTFNAGFWGVNRVPGNVSAWRALGPGALCFFHATSTLGWESPPNSCSQAGIIGVGEASHLGRKESLEWIAEIVSEENGWLHLIHFSQIWWFGRTGPVDDEPTEKKMSRGASAVAADVERTTADRLSFGEIEEQTSYRFLAQRSISGLRVDDRQQGALAELVGRHIASTRRYDRWGGEQNGSKEGEASGGTVDAGEYVTRTARPHRPGRVLRPGTREPWP